MSTATGLVAGAVVAASPALAHWSAGTRAGRRRLRAPRALAYAVYPLHLAVLRAL